MGIQKGIISMNDPAYAEVWKLLGNLEQYPATGQSTYDACTAPTPPITGATSPLATGASTVGMIGGPNGNGQWGGR